MNVSEIQDLYEYNQWANQVLLEAASRVSPEQFTRDLGSSFPSLRDTLVHILGAEWIWLERWRGVSPRTLLDPAGFPDVRSIRTRLQEVENGRQEFLQKLTEAALQQEIGYHNLKGERGTYTLEQMLRHVVNHSTYHRGQVTTMLRQLGAKAASTDYLRYLDARKAGSASAR